MNTSSLTLDEIYALARETLLGAGASEEHADAVADVVEAFVDHCWIFCLPACKV